MWLHLEGRLASRRQGSQSVEYSAIILEACAAIGAESFLDCAFDCRKNDDNNNQGVHYGTLLFIRIR